MDRCILALDQGTTSCRAIVFGKDGKIRACEQQEFTQYTPKESWVEHDAVEIWEKQLKVARKALQTVPDAPESIAALGITNQRETTVLWDKETGRPVSRAIVWQCRRSAEICRELKESGKTDFIRERTGLLPDPYFSGTKIRWLLDQDAHLRKRAGNGEILFGTIDTWLLWNLTGGKAHLTDAGNASRTMLMNLADMNWDDQMLKLLDVPRCMLPEIRPSSGDFGSTSTELFGKSIPITGVAGDQHAALFGHGAFSSGDVKNTYGTGCFTLMNVGDRPVYSRDGLLSTVAWKIGGNTVYALEGSVFMAGAVLQWLRDGLDLIQDVREAAEWAGKAADSGGVYLVPAFQGLGTPWWAPEAKAVLSGLTRASTKSHVCRAFLESIAYRSRDVIDTMLKGCGGTMHHMKVDGGASRSDFLMQFQADILKIPVQRSHTAEVTALGAAMLAGLEAGLWESIETLQTLSGSGGTFEPRMPEEKRRSLYEGWLNAVGNVVN